MTVCTCSERRSPRICCRSPSLTAGRHLPGWTPVDPDTVAHYAANHRRIFFIFAPLGVLPPKVAEEQQLESTLGLSHRAIDRMTAHAVIDTTVVLYER
jgi:hypothetical protein